MVAANKPVVWGDANRKASAKSRLHNPDWLCVSSALFCISQRCLLEVSSREQARRLCCGVGRVQPLVPQLLHVTVGEAEQPLPTLPAGLDCAAHWQVTPPLQPPSRAFRTLSPRKCHGTDYTSLGHVLETSFHPCDHLAQRFGGPNVAMKFKDCAINAASLWCLLYFLSLTCGQMCETHRTVFHPCDHLAQTLGGPNVAM